MDPLTVLWLNAFALNLQRSVKMLAVEQAEPPYLDVKIEAIMLRVRMPSQNGNSFKSKLITKLGWHKICQYAILALLVSPSHWTKVYDPLPLENFYVNTSD